MQVCDLSNMHLDTKWAEPEWMNGVLAQRRSCTQCGRVQFREVAISMITKEK